jgi:hypothetical protein
MDATFFSAPTTMTVGFAHDIVSEYFEQGLSKFSANQTKAPLGVTSHEAHPTLLRTCLEVYVNAGDTSQVKSSKSLQNYASHRGFDHMEALSDEEDEHSNDKSTPDHSELVCLLYHFLVDESVVREWCYDIPLDFFTPDKAVTIATLIGACTRRCSGPFPDGLKSWLENCTARPAEFFMPVARANAVDTSKETGSLSRPCLSLSASRLCTMERPYLMRNKGMNPRTFSSKPHAGSAPKNQRIRTETLH